jgi:hypothetical protein
MANVNQRGLMSISKSNNDDSHFDDDDNEKE